MPVSSHGHTYRKEMTKAYQYFKIGEEFIYTPKSDPDVTLVLEPVETLGLEPVEGCIPMCSSCAIFRFCCKKSNHIEGCNFIPSCYSLSRPDKNSVVFKEVK